MGVVLKTPINWGLWFRSSLHTEGVLLSEGYKWGTDPQNPSLSLGFSSGLIDRYGGFGLGSWPRSALACVKRWKSELKRSRATSCRKDRLVALLAATGLNDLLVEASSLPVRFAASSELAVGPISSYMRV